MDEEEAVLDQKQSYNEPRYTKADKSKLVPC